MPAPHIICAFVSSSCQASAVCLKLVPRFLLGAQVNKNGTFQWALGFGGPGTWSEISYSVSVDTADNVYVAGAVGGDVPASFGPNITLVGLGGQDNSDAFVAKARPLSHAPTAGAGPMTRSPALNSPPSGRFSPPPRPDPSPPAPDA